MLRVGMSVDPSKHRILLVGPRVVHLKPFFERRRYVVTAVTKGVEGMGALDAEPKDIVILELNLGDLTATEFLMAARQAHASASFLLLDDASKAGLIVKALQAGLDGYLPTPPDEDRLFFEVERHLARVSGGSSTSNANNTQVTAVLREMTHLQTQLADRESQIVEMGMQNELLQQEIQKLRADAKKLANLQASLVGVVDGDLDGEQTNRLKERLAMATVLETEVDTLREELASLRNVRRELQEQVDELKRKNEDLNDRLKSRAGDSLEGPALKERAQELEADNMVLEGRLAELQEELDLAKGELVGAEQKWKAEREDLERQLNLLSSDQALKAADVEELSIKHAATVAKLEEKLASETARLKKEHADDVARLKRDQADEMGRFKDELENKLKRAVSDAEIERAELLQKLADAKGAAAQSASLAEREKELRAQLDAAVAEKDQAVEKALDIELVLDEMKTKIEFLEGESRRASERVQKAEADFKREKLRLIEEKEQAASGSQEAFQKLQKFIDENLALKRQNTELENMRSGLEERAKRGDDAARRAEAELQQAAVIRAEAFQQRDAAESALKATEERLTTMERQLRDEVKTLQARLDDEKRRAQAAERALADASQAANKLADANAARDTAEREAARLQEKVQKLEKDLEVTRADVEKAKKETDAARADVEKARADAEAEREALKKAAGNVDARARELEKRVAALEDAVQARDRSLRESAEALAAAQAATERVRVEVTEHYEARLRDALLGAPNAATDVITERDAYRARLAETEAWVQQAQLHLEALRAERDQLAAQATALADDAHLRAAESQELYAQLAAAKQSVEALTARAAGFEQELLIARQQLTQRSATQGPDPQAFAQAQEEIRALRMQLQQVSLQAQSKGRLPEELEPLRWTLTAAVDALTALEGREPGLASHLRNLRLLAGTLQRLSANGS